MIARPTTKNFGVLQYFLKYIFLLLLLPSLTANGQCKDDCVPFNRSDDQNCDLKNTSLTRCSELDDYRKADLKLNKNYKELATKLNQIDISKLRNPQRAWIKWREEKCDDIDAKANCDNGACAGYAHDTCLVDLTEKRAAELSSFSNDLETARHKNFAFSKDYSQ